VKEKTFDDKGGKRRCRVVGREAGQRTVSDHGDRLRDLLIRNHLTTDRSTAKLPVL
jgi:hypothetical protein